MPTKWPKVALGWEIGNDWRRTTSCAVVFQNARCRCLEKAGTVAASSSLLLTFWLVHLEILPQRAVLLIHHHHIIIIINHPSSSSNTLIQLFKDFPRPAQNLEWKPSYLGKDLGHLLRFFAATASEVKVRTGTCTVFLQRGKNWGNGWPWGIENDTNQM